MQDLPVPKRADHGELEARRGSGAEHPVAVPQMGAMKLKAFCPFLYINGLNVKDLSDSSPP